MKQYENNKLYRKDEGGNCHFGHTRRYFKGERYKYERNSKAVKEQADAELAHTSHKKQKITIDSTGGYEGYNYSPLFKYLLKQVGKVWKEVWEDVFPRVDCNYEPISFMVCNISKNGLVINLNHDMPWTFRFGEEQYWSSLYVDENGILQYVNKNYIPTIDYEGWGQSFNGKPLNFKKKKRKNEKNNIQKTGEETVATE